MKSKQEEQIKAPLNESIPDKDTSIKTKSLLRSKTQNHLKIPFPNLKTQRKSTFVSNDAKLVSENFNDQSEQIYLAETIKQVVDQKIVKRSRLLEKLSAKPIANNNLVTLDMFYFIKSLNNCFPFLGSYIKGKMKERVYQPGEIIFYEDTIVNNIIFVRKGQLDLYRMASKGKDTRPKKARANKKSRFTARFLERICTRKTIQRIDKGIIQRYLFDILIV